MKFGLFGGATADSGDPEAVPGQGFRDFVEFNVEAEALGYHGTFQVEHRPGFDESLALRAAGAGYVLLSFAASRASLRRFAREIAPHFRNA